MGIKQKKWLVFLFGENSDNSWERNFFKSILNCHQSIQHKKCLRNIKYNNSSHKTLYKLRVPEKIHITFVFSSSNILKRMFTILPGNELWNDYIFNIGNIFPSVCIRLSLDFPVICGVVFIMYIWKS